jgi:hypothetical protein
VAPYALKYAALHNTITLTTLIIKAIKFFFILTLLVSLAFLTVAFSKLAESSGVADSEQDINLYLH